MKVGDRVYRKEYGKGTIIHSEKNDTGILYLVKFDNKNEGLHDGAGMGMSGHCWWFPEFELELITFTKKDLKDGDRITLRNGDVGYIDNNGVLGTGLSYGTINDDLTNGGSCGKSLDIVKVERPVKYRTVYTRTEVREMTVEEISRELGYEVKVVK